MTAGRPGALLLALALLSAPCPALGAGAPPAPVSPERNAPAGGHAFSFGQSPDRRSPLWTRGMGAASLAPKARAAQNGASKAIEKALDDAAKSRQPGGFGVSMKKDARTWARQPLQVHPDEKLNLDSRHVVRAFADLESGPDFSVTVGPELILKDEYNTMSRTSNSDQPDSALGLGMNFKLDF